MTKRKITGVVWLCAALWASVFPLRAASTAFTYQGRLAAGGVPASGAYDFRFSLWDAVAGGDDLASPLVAPSIQVTGGVFTATIDFGSAVFNGTNLWLELAVSPSGAGQFTTLAPRQALAPAPLAIYAANAGEAASAGTLSTTLPSSQLTGLIPAALLPGGLITNSASGVSLSGSFSGSGAGLTNIPSASLIWADTLTNNISGSAAYATNAGTAADVPWSALPGPVLTNAAAFQPASSALSNLANNNGSLLTNLNANSISGTFASVSFLLPVTWIPTNTPVEEVGNAGAMPFGSNPGAGLIQLMTNTFTLTNITAGFSGTAGSLYPTGAIVKIWQVANPTNLQIPFNSTALATNTTVVFPGVNPYQSSPVLTPISFPPTLVTNGGWLVVAAICTNYAANAIQVNDWFQSAANTNIPRPLVLMVTSSGLVEGYNGGVANYNYGGAGYRAYGYVTQEATNLTTYLNAVAGNLSAASVTNAASLPYSTNASDLPIAAQTAQAALDYLATNQHLPLALPNYPDTSRVFLFDGDSRSSPIVGPLQWAQRWLTNYPFFSRAQIIPLGHGGTGPWDCVTNYPLYVHPWANTAGPYDVYYSIYSGVNNLTNVAYSWSNYTWCVQQATNDGLKPIMWTLAGNSGWTANMLQFNELVRANYQSYGAILMAPDVLFPQSPNTNYYYDGEHPTTNAMIALCAQLDAAVRGNNGVTTLTPITNTWALLSSPGGLPLGVGVGGGVNNVALTVTASNSVSLSSSLSATGGVFLFSPNGTRYLLRVDNSGNLSAVQQ